VNVPPTHRGWILRMQGKLNLIAAKASKDKRIRFTSLIHLIDEISLKQSYDELKRNKACGIDQMTVQAYGENLQERLKLLAEKLKSRSYKPQPIRRVYIPKPGKEEKRMLGIYTVEDKLVQGVLKKILESIYEVDFLDCSYGFRPGRNCHQAIKVLDKATVTKPINYVVEVDIRKFFDNIEHQWLLESLKQRIKDPKILGLIKCILKSGAVDDGKYLHTRKGVSQGGVLSPLLANVYMHYVLDLWFEKIIKRQAHGVMQLIRYCDDFVICCESQTDANRFLILLRDRLKKFGLEVAEEKTNIIEFGKKTWQLFEKRGIKPKSFNFLGFTHYGVKSRRGKWTAGHKTSKENFARKLKEIKVWLKQNRNKFPLKEWWPVLKAKLVGHFNYFGISGNIRCLSQFQDKVKLLIFKWINRRSQKKSMTTENFWLYMKKYPLPKSRIHFSLY